MKKIIKVILFFLGISILMCLVILPFDNISRKEIDAMVIEDVDLSELEDGEYIGNFQNRVRKYSVEVTVKDHKITNIKPINEVSNDVAKKLFASVIREQKTDVDTISGATITSKMILKAIEEALNSGN